MTRTSLTASQTTLIEHFAAEGRGPKWIAAEINRRRFLDDDGNPATRDKIRDWLRSNSISTSPPQAPPEKNDTGPKVRTDTPSVTIEEASPPPVVTTQIGSINRRVPLPGFHGTQAERAKLFRWFMDLMEDAMDGAMPEDGDGKRRLERCESCGQVPAQVVDIITKALTRGDKLIRSAEQSEDGAPRRELAIISIAPPVVSAPPAIAGAVPERDASPLLNAEMVAGIASYLELHGLAWQDLIDYLYELREVEA